MEVASPGPWSKYGGGTTKTKITDGYFGEGYRIEGRTASWNTIGQELSCSTFTQVNRTQCHFRTLVEHAIVTLVVRTRIQK